MTPTLRDAITVEQLVSVIERAPGATSEIAKQVATEFLKLKQFRPIEHYRQWRDAELAYQAALWCWRRVCELNLEDNNRK